MTRPQRSLYVSSGDVWAAAFALEFLLHWDEEDDVDSEAIKEVADRVVKAYYRVVDYDEEDTGDRQAN